MAPQGTHGDTPAVHYALRFDAAAQHLVDVEATFVGVLASGPGHVDCHLPVWTPGSYMVREYARHVEGLVACGGNGQVLPVCKVDKNIWRVQATAAAAVADDDEAAPKHTAPADLRLRYRVYGRELSVRTNFIDADVALLQGAATFLYLPERMDRPHAVTVHLPRGWPGVESCLAGRQVGNTGHYSAKDYAALVDGPILAGALRSHAFDAAGIRHTLTSVGGAGLFDDRAATLEVQRIVEEQQAFWGQVPYTRYRFLNVLLGGQGGLEHADGAVTMAAPTARHGQEARANWWGLMSHELFHAWNGKRLRPVALGPFDYARENLTPSLWVAEGFTAYYDDLLVCRAGLVDEATYLTRLAKSLQALAQTPGRHQQAVRDASFDAWIKLYRRDENTDNTGVSYYLKGSVIAFVLDAFLRQQSAGAVCLDHVMRQAFRQFSGALGYTEEQLRAVFAAVLAPHAPAQALVRLQDLLCTLVDRPGEVPLEAALDTYGLVYAPEPAVAAGADLQLAGVRTELVGGRHWVREVRREHPAYAEGLNVGDELVAVGDVRLGAGPLSDVLPQALPVTALSPHRAPFLLARHGLLRRLELTLATQAPKPLRLRVRHDAQAAQHAARAAWLRGHRVETTGA